MKNSSRFPLNLCHVMKTDLRINRFYMFFLGIALSVLFYYRTTTISHIIKTRESTPLLPHLLIFISELTFTYIWIVHQGFRWRPVTRTVHPERLPRNIDFPAIDIFICTADPSKEPPLGVMNTVISAMALDYPSDKIAVYLHDDGGSDVTLQAMKEAWKFAKSWLPFCRKYQLKTRCPQAYFSAAESHVDDHNKFITPSEFVSERKEIEKRYMEFKEIVEKNSANANGSVSRDHSPIIEVIDHANDGDALDSSQQEYQNMPILVYVSREKRPSHPHHFKAGAVNTLIRVSAVMSNAPYILVLDCDHYCNDPSSPRQAMCFFLDTEISSNLAWVQFPQKFHGMSDHDLYESRLNYYWRRWHGADGLRGPFISGCNMYVKREALYGSPKNINNDHIDINQSKKTFGSSNELIKSIYTNTKPYLSKDQTITDAMQKEVNLLASCTYDIQSKWGKEVGFMYFSVAEDNFTSEMLHCRGWTSVFIDPPRPCFLGSCPTNLGETLVQQARWGIGLMQIFLSKYCALLYGPGRMSILQCMCYAASSSDPVCVIPFYFISIIPQICLLHGIPLYPKVSDPFFIVFAFIFIASQLKHVQEVVSYGASIRDSLYELRFWMMKSASSYLYAALGVFLDKIGAKEAHFTLTNKVVDDEQMRRFHEGVYDFQASPLLIAPICSLYILNVASFIIGIVRILQSRKGDELFVQAFVPLFGIIVNYHVLEGMVLRKDKGRVSPSVTLLSLAVASSVLCFGSLIILIL